MTRVSLLQKLTMPRERWEEPLWNEIQLHAHIDTLHAQLINMTWIIIVSVATIYADNHGTCAWTIWSNTELWTGKGFVPGHPDNMYSGLAEAYGIYTALSFLQQYCTYYPWSYKSNKQYMHIVTTKKSSTVPPGNPWYPTHKMQSVTATPSSPKLLRLSKHWPTPSGAHHIQGHQDTKLDKPLTIPEKLNIYCDAQALTMGKYHQLETIQQNPRNTSSYSHLVIQGKVVIQHLQHTLRNACIWCTLRKNSHGHHAHPWLSNGR